MVKKLLLFYRGSLKVELITMILFFSLLSLGILAGVLTWQGRDQLYDSLLSTQNTLAQTTAQSVNAKLLHHQEILTVIAQQFTTDLEDLTSVQDTLHMFATLHPEYADVFIANPSGEYVTASNTSGSIGDKPYFQKTLSGQPSISNPVHFDNSTEWTFILAIPLKRAEQIIGVMGAAIPIAEFVEILGQIKVGASGYAYILDDEYQLVYHPKKDYIMNDDVIKNDPEFYQVVTSMYELKQDTIEYIFKGDRKFQTFTPISGTDWLLAITVPFAEITLSISRFERIALLVIAVSTLILTVAMYLIIDRLTRRIRHIQENIRRAEEGDLTAIIPNPGLQKCWEIMNCAKATCPAYNNDNLRCWQIAGTHCRGEVQGEMASKLTACEQCKTYKISSGNELIQLAESYNNMLLNLSNTVQLVLQTSEDVASASQTLSAALEESNAALEEISASTEELTASSQQVASDLESSVNEIEEMTRISHSTANSSSLVKEKSLAIGAEANAGETHSVKTEEKMLQITQQTKLTYEDMQKLQMATEEIKKIIEVISNIANQTNLLALNAQIEAARAGNEGLGFAVVANEINDLAKDSSTAAQQIAAILKNIQQQVTSVAQIMTNEVAEIDEGLTSVKNLREKIVAINYNIALTNTSVEQIVGLSKEQVRKADQTNDRIHNISQAISHSVHTFGSINDALAEQSANFEEINASAAQLAEMSEKLRQSMEYFIIEEK